MKHFCAALHHAQRSELDYAIFFASLSKHPKAGELAYICQERLAACRELNIKACEYAKKKWYRHASRQFAKALKINAQDETARLGLIATAGRGFIL